ncbi:lipoprotein, partial [Pantoea sp. CTOTU49201]
MKKTIMVLSSVAILSGCGMMHKQQETPQQLRYQ